MLTDNYRLIKKIKTTYNFEIFLALSFEENKEIIIKTTKDLYTHEKDIKSLQSENEKLKLCNNKYVIKTNELKKSGDRYFLILEHFRARTIKMILEDNKIAVSDFIKIAINICEAFIEIHSKNIIHANLNTNSILLNKKNDIKLTNFTPEFLIGHPNFHFE